VSPVDAEILSDHHEVWRLSVDRRLGWNAVPSNNFNAHKRGSELILEGVGQGQGGEWCRLSQDP
jgi:hypothetical protein